MGRVLVGCETSGITREAFRAHGHAAYSCDLLPAEDASPFHVQGDVLTLLADDWDLLIVHPPCTHLATSGARWFAQKGAQIEDALAFVRALLAAPVPRLCLENPKSIISSRITPPSQTIQPYDFGHPESKATCLWLRNLPYLQPTRLAWPRDQKVWLMGESKARSRNRSRSYPGIAAAMAGQWGPLLPH